MSVNIHDAFDKHLGHLTFDTKLYRSIQRFRIAWMQKSDKYAEFLGGTLLGVHEIRFSTRDEDMFMVDVLKADYSAIAEDCRNMEGIDLNRKVSSNPFNLTIGYLMYRFINSKVIGKDLNKALTELYLIFAYKVTGSLLSKFFSFNTTEAIARATYEKLNNKFMLKQKGSWQALYEYRAIDTHAPNGLHYKRLKRYNASDAVYVINDLQGRIREYIKNIYEVFMNVIKDGTAIRSSSAIEIAEDGDSIRDIVNRKDKYINYLYGIVNKKNDFIQDDLIYLIQMIIPNLAVDNFKTLLTYVSENEIVKPGSDNDYYESIITITIAYLDSKKISNNYNQNVQDVLIALRGYWGSSRVSNPQVAILKNKLNKIVKKAIKKNTNWIIVTTVIAFCMYIFLRAIAGKK